MNSKSTGATLSSTCQKGDKEREGERERERERDRRNRERECVCVCEREREIFTDKFSFCNCRFQIIHKLL